MTNRVTGETAGSINVNPFLIHSQLNDQYQAFLGGGDVNGMATITFNAMATMPPLPCTHTEVGGDSILVASGAGFSPKTMIEIVEIKASLLAGYNPRKGHKCSLLVNQKLAPVRLQVWSLNTAVGGELIRLNLVDENFAA